MKVAPENKPKMFALLGVAVVALGVAGYMIFRPTGGIARDSEQKTEAAMEKSRQMQANMKSAVPPPPDLPVESRPPRRAVVPK